ncbi:MAG: c-type cytochrome [Cyanobacteria bacterium P01_E01_bin.6]
MRRHQRFLVIIGFVFCLWAWLIVPPSFADPISASTTHAELASPSPDGATLFDINCAGCHANGGNIIRRGKNLRMKALTKNQMDSVDAIAHIVTVGKRPMSAYGDKLSAEEIQAVSRYVLARAEQDWK